jgi:hypothetical protein
LNGLELWLDPHQLIVYHGLNQGVGMLCGAFGGLIKKHALCLLGIDNLNLGVVFEVRFYQMVNQGTFLGQVRGPT